MRITIVSAILALFIIAAILIPPEGSSRAIAGTVVPGTHPETMMLPNGVRVVDQSANGANNGQSWANAYESLQTALSQAADPGGIDEIWVKADTYSPGGSASDTFELAPGVLLRGGFVGDETSFDDMYARNVYDNETILDGGDTNYHVVTVLDIGTGITVRDTLIDGFIIRDGDADGTEETHEVFGGGMYVEDAEVYILRCRFGGSEAAGGGGLAVFGNDSEVNVFNCEFTENAATVGGGLFNDGGKVRLFNCLFEDNSGPLGGGAIRNYRQEDVAPEASQTKTMEVNNCTIVFNTSAAVVQGAGISNESAMTIRNCIVWNNEDDEDNNDEDEEIDEEDNLSSGYETAVTNVYNTTIGASSFNLFSGNDNSLDEPMFVNQWSGNYRLTAESHAVDSGSGPSTVDYNDEFDINDDSITSELTLDLDNDVERVVGCAIDRGAWEFVSPCFADLNSDDTVNVLDLLIMLGAWGYNPSHAADLTEDDEVNVHDLLLMLAAWGPCEDSTECVLWLETELENSELSWSDWNEFMGLFEAWPVDEEAIENYVWWLHHYLQCHNNQTCNEVYSGNPDDDPFSGH